MVVTDVVPGKRNKNRVNIYIDGAYSFSCYIETAVRCKIRKSAELSERAVSEIKEEDGKTYAVETALKFVASKMRTEKEICDKLREKEVDGQYAGHAIEKLREYGYVDDAHYAALYAQELRQKYGPRMIKQKLAQKGIGSETVEALELMGGDTLAAQAARLYERHKGEEPQKRKQKIIRSLLQKGFEYEEIRRAVEKLDES